MRVTLEVGVTVRVGEAVRVAENERLVDGVGVSLCDAVGGGVCEAESVEDDVTDAPAENVPVGVGLCVTVAEDVIVADGDGEGDGETTSNAANSGLAGLEQSLANGKGLLHCANTQHAPLTAHATGPSWMFFAAVVRCMMTSDAA